MASEIEKDASQSLGPSSVTAAIVYQLVGDWVWDSDGEITFSGVLAELNSNFQFTRKEFLTKFRRLKRVYENNLANVVKNKKWNRKIGLD